jgi:hypothetical protein
MMTPETIAIHYNDASWIDVEAMSSDELRALLKRNGELKANYQQWRSAQVSWFEWLKWNVRFFVNKVQKRK